MSAPESEKPGVGRPELPAGEKTQPRSIRLNDVRWAKLQRLGRRWLEQMIDQADDASATAGAQD